MKYLNFEIDFQSVVIHTHTHTQTRKKTGTSSYSIPKLIKLRRQLTQFCGHNFTVTLKKWDQTRSTQYIGWDPNNIQAKKLFEMQCHNFVFCVCVFVFPVGPFTQTQIYISFHSALGLSKSN